MLEQDSAINDQNVKDVMASLFVVGKAFKGMLADGKIGLSDLPALMSLKPQVEEISAKLLIAKVELQHLNPAEVKDIMIALGEDISGIGADAKFIDKMTKGIAAVESLSAFYLCFKK